MSFSFKVNLADAKVRTGGMQDVEPGVYAGKTIECDAYNNGKSIRFLVDLGDAGETEIYVGTDFSKAGNKNSLITALASHGKNVEKIKGAGEITVGPDFFVGKPCFVIVRKVEGVDDQGRQKLNDKSFLPPDRFEAMKNLKPKASAPAAKSEPAPAPAGTTSAALFD